MSNVINFPKKSKTFESYDRLFSDLKSELQGWNIESVADAAEVAPATIYFWLDGRTKYPLLRTVAKVAEVLGYDIELVLKHKTARANKKGVQ